MKRVLHVIDHLGLGGAQAVLLDLVTLTDSSKWHCEVAVMHGRGLFAEILEQRGIKVHSLSPSLWPPRYFSSFVQLQRQFDLLHFHLSGANWIAKPLAAMVGEQPRIVHDHASADLRFRGVGSMLIDAIMHRFSSHTIAVAPEVKNFLMHYEALSSGEITIIPNGVNTEIFRPFTVNEKREARQLFNLQEEDIIIGTVGRLAAEKNQKMFLQAAKTALQQGLQAIFLIAGTGPEEETLRKLTRQLGIVEQVRFLGQVQDRISLYRAFDLFALTSSFEGLPMVILEAMASGIPVVSTDLEGIHHALEGGRYGTLVPPGNSEILAQVFLQYNRLHQKQFIENARSKVERDFSAVQAAMQVGQLYQSLCD